MQSSAVAVGTAAILAAIAWLVPEYRLVQLSLIAAMALVAVGLAVVTGIAGQVSLAQAAFMAIGAYGSTLLALKLGVPMWAAIMLSTIGAGLFGYLFGALAMRVEDQYLALATMAFTAILQQVLTQSEALTGGAAGLAVPSLILFGYPITTTRQLYLLTAFIAVLAFWGLNNLLRSRIGRAWSAMRQSEIAAATLGVDLLHHKSLAFSLSAALGALGGALQALQTPYLDPAQYGILLSVYYLAVVVVGGLRSIYGAVVGSLIFVLFPELLSMFRAYMAFVFALMLLGFIILFPQGVSGVARLLRRAG
jgi:branched-chain amino acid transport system permease protein